MPQDFDLRRAEPGQTFGYTAQDGSQRELKADDEGVVEPKTAEDVAILDTFDLPVARKAMAELKAAEPGADKPKKPASPADDGGN
jgi:hypothetical protein